MNLFIVHRICFYLAANKTKKNHTTIAKSFIITSLKFVKLPRNLLTPKWPPTKRNASFNASQTPS